MHRAAKIVLGAAGSILGLLLLIQIAGSPFATRLVNQKLGEMPQFTGRVRSVSLQLWRGTVSVRDFELTDRANLADGPVVMTPHATLSISWAPLFRGRLGGDVDIDRPRILMVKHAESSRDEKQKAEKLAKPLGRAWQEALSKQFPFEFRKIEIKDAQVKFDDRSDPQAASLIIDDIDLTLTEFSNREKDGEALPATLRMSARIAESGTLTVDARADPADVQPRFEVKLEIKGLSLPAMHDFLVRYALIDVRSGEFELYAEASAAGGGYEGYTKPFFKNLEFEAVPDPEKNLLQRAATKVAAAVQDALKNERGDVATKAPFHGNFEDNEVDVWTTLENLLRNAFIQGLREGLEGQPSGAASN